MVIFHSYGNLYQAGYDLTFCGIKDAPKIRICLVLAERFRPSFEPPQVQNMTNVADFKLYTMIISEIHQLKIFMSYLVFILLRSIEVSYVAFSQAWGPKPLLRSV